MTTKTGQAKPVVVVDDDEASLYVKGKVLRAAGYVVVEVRTGRQALEEIARHNPDIVVLDIQLPDISGLEICRIIKAKQVPALVLHTSATFVHGGDRVVGLEGGADGYLVEPTEPEELVATVRALLRARMAETELRRLNETLEARVAERTRQLEESNRQLRVEIEERQRAEETLRQSQKLEAVGQLTGGIAHDFNNLLAIIYSGLDTIRRRLPKDDQRLQFAIDHCMKSAMRAASLTQHLLAFSRRQTLHIVAVRPHALVQELQELLNRTLGESIRVQVQVGPDIWQVNTDANQLENALINLAVNARDAMPGGGTLTISAANLAAKDAEGVHPELQSRDYVRLSVNDTGMGMRAELIERVFEPFFTTKPAGEGTGLGLSQVYGFIKQSGGHVEIESEVDVGTTVSLYLPRDEGIAAAPHKGAAKRTEVSGDERQGAVLVVEDNEGVRAFSAAGMEDLGFRVVSAANGKEAMQLLAQHSDIVLLFADIGLPGGMSGVVLAEDAVKLRPGLRTLLTTGYAGSETDGLQHRSNLLVLNKPYTFDELREAVDQALS